MTNYAYLFLCHICICSSLTVFFFFFFIIVFRLILSCTFVLYLNKVMFIIYLCSFTIFNLCNLTNLVVKTKNFVFSLDVVESELSVFLHCLKLYPFNIVGTCSCKWSYDQIEWNFLASYIGSSHNFNKFSNSFIWGHTCDSMLVISVCRLLTFVIKEFSLQVNVRLLNIGS